MAKDEGDKLISEINFSFIFCGSSEELLELIILDYCDGFGLDKELALLKFMFDLAATMF